MIELKYGHRPNISEIPQDPGVYKFRNSKHKVIYVGKAKNLRSRLQSYFQDTVNLSPKTAKMVENATNLEWTIVANENEALQLEYTWIKQFNPYFNIRFKDDKTYPFLAVTINDKYPRFSMYRGERKPKVRYFGPYTQSWAIRETLDLLSKTFPVRTCSETVFRRHALLDRPCLLGYIDKCSAPCTNKVSEVEYRNIVNGACNFISGNSSDIISHVQDKMIEASNSQAYEQAIIYRDKFRALQMVLEKQTVILNEEITVDVIAIESDELLSAIGIFHIKNGRVKGQSATVFPTPENDGSEISSKAFIMNQFITQFYAEEIFQEKSIAEAALKKNQMDNSQFDPSNDWSTTNLSPIPKEILVSDLPDEKLELENFLSELRKSRVEIKLAVRGNKKILADTVHRNAVESLIRSKTKRSMDLNSRSEALDSIAKYLNISHGIMRMECIDISHNQGSFTVGSLVVFEDGLPKKSDYRHYKIKKGLDYEKIKNSNDIESVEEVISSRFKDGKNLPDLLIIDGARPQANIAKQTLDNLHIEIPVIGLSKRLEQIWLPDKEDPLILPRNSESLYILQYIRDESHRFAIDFHRKQRSMELKKSVLDNINGIGPAKRRSLLKEFKSISRIKNSTIEELLEVKSISKNDAKNIKEYFSSVS